LGSHNRRLRAGSSLSIARSWKVGRPGGRLSGRTHLDSNSASGDRRGTPTPWSGVVQTWRTQGVRGGTSSAAATSGGCGQRTAVEDDPPGRLYEMRSSFAQTWRTQGVRGGTSSAVVTPAVAVSEQRQKTTHRVVCTRCDQISYSNCGEPKGFVVARLYSTLA